ncbi:hypothetical protein [Vulcanisaeta distributa]|uniref:hypothetical protein n=1 Tax=Vulcanisaeta distributa TaxID=164451 RepID=UPI000A65625D|nr:hypothetical protein [Vulcanisaeta distributa]
MLIRELRRGGGTRGSEYAYVLIGNELVHVSEVGKLVGRGDDEYVYEVPSNVSPWIYIFRFSRSGYGSVARCLSSSYVDMVDYTKCESKAIEDAVNNWLSNVSFRIRNPELRDLLSELFGEFVTMANEARNYWRSVNGELSFMGHASRCMNSSLTRGFTTSRS